MSSKKCNVKNTIRIAAAIVASAVIMLALFTISGEAPGGLSDIKPVFQADYKKAITVIAGEEKSVWTSGCGAVALSMAVGFMAGCDVSCEDMFKWACDKGLYNGNGLDHSALVAMLKPYALTGKWIKNDRIDLVARALDAGYPVVAHVGPGTFTKNGHYILLIGHKDGMALVNDPGSRERSGKYFDLKLIQSELRRENSFMIITRL